MRAVAGVALRVDPSVGPSGPREGDACQREGGALRVFTQGRWQDAVVGPAESPQGPAQASEGGLREGGDLDPNGVRFTFCVEPGPRVRGGPREDLEHVWQVERAYPRLSESRLHAPRAVHDSITFSREELVEAQRAVAQSYKEYIDGCLCDDYPFWKRVQAWLMLVRRGLQESTCREEIGISPPAVQTKCPTCMDSGVLRHFALADETCPDCKPAAVLEQGPSEWEITKHEEVEPCDYWVPGERVWNIEARKGDAVFVGYVSTFLRQTRIARKPWNYAGETVLEIRGERAPDMAIARLLCGLRDGTVAADADVQRAPLPSSRSVYPHPVSINVMQS